MNRVLPWSIACALLASCSTDREASGGSPPVIPIPDVQPPLSDGPLTPDIVPAPAAPARPEIIYSGEDLTPRPGRPHYPDCTATRRDICLQVNKKVPGPHPGPGPNPKPKPKPRPVPPPPIPDPPCPGCLPPPPPDCPECLVETGFGSFGRPAAVAVNQTAGLEFAIGMDQETIIRELGDTPPAGYRDINLAECMRITLDTPAGVEIVGPNAQVKQLPKGKPGDFWNWSIRPKRTGAYTVHAKVEVLRSEDGKCTEIPLDAFTRRVPLEVSAAGPPPPPPRPSRLCLGNGREVPCDSWWWNWKTLGWLTLSILLVGLAIAIIAKGRRRAGLRRGDE